MTYTRKTYKFTLDPANHKDIMAFLEDFPRCERGKCVIEALRQPYTKGKFLIDAKIAKRQTAAEYLRELEKIGILEAHKIGKEILYLNSALYSLLLR